MLTRWLAPVVLLLLPPGEALAQSSADVVTVTDAMLQDPDPSDWLMWRRTLDSWGYSPLDQIDRRNVDDLRMVWDTEILDYRKNPAHQTSGPIIANGKVVSGRGCIPKGGPDACVVTAHDAMTGEELWRTRLIPAPGEPGDETWGGVPYERRRHVGAWMVPSFDPELNLIYVGTSVTSPSPKYLLGGADKQHLYHNSTLALDVDTGEIRWYYQHLNDHWDLDHPFERLLVDTAVSPSASAVQWINPRLRPGRSPRTRRSSSAQRGRR